MLMLMEEKNCFSLFHNFPEKNSSLNSWQNLNSRRQNIFQLKISEVFEKLEDKY